MHKPKLFEQRQPIMMICCLLGFIQLSFPISLKVGQFQHFIFF